MLLLEFDSRRRIDFSRIIRLSFRTSVRKRVVRYRFSNFSERGQKGNRFPLDFPTRRKRYFRRIPQLLENKAITGLLIPDLVFENEIWFEIVCHLERSSGEMSENWCLSVFSDYVL